MRRPGCTSGWAAACRVSAPPSGSRYKSCRSAHLSPHPRPRSPAVSLRPFPGIVNGSVALLAKWLLIMAVIELVLFLTTTTVSALQVGILSPAS